jgi:hypothetical protein
MWRLLDVVKWNYDDAILYACAVIAYDPLRMRITNLTLPLHKYAFNE